MKVPSPVRPSTQRTNQGLAYANASSGLESAEAIGASMSRLGAAVKGYEEKVLQQKRLSALASMSDWQQETSAYLTQLRRDSPEDDATYYERADAEITNRENKFLANVDPRFAPEFQMRIREMGNSFRGQELDFDLKKKDAYSRGVIERETERGKQSVGRDAAQLRAQRESMYALIDQTTLSDMEKAERRRLVDRELEQVGYATRVREEALAQDQLQEPVEAYVDKIFQTESAGKANAKNPNSTATGPAQFIESTWKEFLAERYPEELANPKALSLRTDPELSREATIWYAQKNAKRLGAAGVPVNEGTLKLAHFAGPEGAVRVYTAGPNTPVEEILGADVVKANGFLKGKTAGWLVDWAYQQMGRKDAYSRVDYDPEYSNLFYEDRVNIRADVARQLKDEITAATKAAEDARKERVDQLYTGLYDGTLGSRHIAEARKRGDLSSYDEIKKANTILEDREGESAGAARIIAGLEAASPAPMSNDITEDYKAANAFAKKFGILNGIDRMDSSVGPVLTELGGKLQILPRDAMDKLNAGAQSLDWNRRKYALETLANIYETLPELTGRMTTDEELDRVLTYRGLRGYYPEEQLRETLMGFGDPDLQRARETLREEGLEWLDSKSYNERTVLKEFSSLFMAGESLSEIPAVAGESFNNDFRALFADYYSKFRDTDKAWDATMTMLRQNWGFHDDGDKKRFMRFPPEAFLPPLEGDHSRLRASIREELGLTQGDSYELVPDSQTAHEARMKRGGRRAEAPSYRVVVRENDVPRLLDQRYFPAYKPEQLEEVKRNFDVRNSQMELRRQREAIRSEMANAITQSAYVPALRDDALIAEYEQQIKALDAAIAEKEAELIPPPAPHTDVASPDDLMAE